MNDQVLKTNRLLLQPVQMADAAAIAALACEFDVARMTARMPHPYTIDDARDWIGQIAGSGETVFAIAHDGELIGCAGYMPLDDARAEIGYWLGKPWWGRGLATEAARALVQDAFEAGGFEQIDTGHFADNAASGRVLEKLGFKYIHDEMRPCRARGGSVLSREFRLMKSGHDAEQPQAAQ
jgi:RimJ/RimL family protein N-acetyltransferase